MNPKDMGGWGHCTVETKKSPSMKFEKVVYSVLDENGTIVATVKREGKSEPELIIPTGRNAISMTCLEMALTFMKSMPKSM